VTARRARSGRRAHPPAGGPTSGARRRPLPPRWLPVPPPAGHPQLAAGQRDDERASRW
jgi:hypothetical protein